MASPAELPLALGVAALELQQKRPEAGPAAAAAFGEGGGSGEGFAILLWLKVRGKRVNARLQRAATYTWCLLSPAIGDQSRPLCSRKGLSGGGSGGRPPWRARSQPGHCGSLKPSKSASRATPSPKRFARKRERPYGVSRLRLRGAASRQCLGVPKDLLRGAMRGRAG